LWPYDVGSICNCCGCCCIVLRGITQWGIKHSVAQANYHAVINSDECLNCGICIDRCQVDALTELDGSTVVDLERCVGCGLCVTGCPHDAVRLRRKPEAELIHPPVDFADWEADRRRHRDILPTQGMQPTQ
jgi:ferredoxin